jgi:hypothetical protein
LVGVALLSAEGVAHAQGAVRDQTSAVTATPADQTAKSWIERRFGGSYAELSTYVGSGSFYTSGYRDPYVSNALNLRPMLMLNEKYKLNLNARIYIEEEYTTPDTSNARRFYPLDSWLVLHAKNLYTAPRAKITFGGSLRATAPTSYESRYAHLITNLSVGAGATRPFEFGRPDAQGKRWNLILSLSGAATKSLRTSETRGNFPGDTTGCRLAGPAGYNGGGGGAPDTDRCGGPLNTSYTFTTAGTAILTRGKWSFTTMLVVINDFKYEIDPVTTALIVSQTNQVPRGRNDWTWGIVSVGYDLTEHLGLAVGVASYQPALDSRYQHVRFPFFDFNGGNANNYTQAFLSVTGTL